MMEINLITTSFLSSAIISSIAGFIIKKGFDRTITHQLSVELEKVKANLHIENQSELEKLKNALQLQSQKELESFKFQLNRSKDEFLTSGQKELEIIKNELNMQSEKSLELWKSDLNRRNKLIDEQFSASNELVTIIYEIRNRYRGIYLSIQGFIDEGRDMNSFINSDIKFSCIKLREDSDKLREGIQKNRLIMPPVFFGIVHETKHQIERACNVLETINYFLKSRNVNELSAELQRNFNELDDSYRQFVLLAQQKFIVE